MESAVKRNGSPSALFDIEESLLKAARNNDVRLLSDLIAARRSGQIVLSLNCKGKKKGTRGWTALHLAAYFGNDEIAEKLLENGADPNVANDDGDTPLHKAALTSRTKVVDLLLKYDANVFAINGEGKTAVELATEGEAKSMLDDCKTAGEKIRENAFLGACKDGDLQLMKELLVTYEMAPKVNINCIDRLGNTALHSAAYRGNQAVAIFLLENGIDTTIRNNNGRVAADLATYPAMKEMLGVPPIRSLSRTPFRYQGPLFRHMRFRGWRPFWIVVDRGVISYYNTQGNASAHVKRRAYKHLNSAVVRKAPEDNGIFVIKFSDGDVHRLTLTPHCVQRAVERQKWISVIGEHIEFSTRMLTASVEDDEDDDLVREFAADIPTNGSSSGRLRRNVSFVYSDPQTSYRVRSLRSMKDALQTAEAYKQLLAQDVETLSNTFQQLPIAYRQGALFSMTLRVDNVQRTARDVVESLTHCLNLFRQQEDLRLLELKRYKEKCRVLEDSLLVLAKQHHNLELTVSTGVSHEIGVHPISPRNPPTSKDKLKYDELEVDGSDPTISNASSYVNIPDLDQDLNSSGSEYNTPYGSMTDLRLSAPSPMVDVGQAASSDFGAAGGGEDGASKEEERSEYGRLSLPAEMPEKDVFNLWSILKSCIGKDLSKITMPVVWNEPVSILQRFAESMEYSTLLETAAMQDDPVARMEYVAAFAVSALSRNWDRLMKPFNPLLGETYELERNNFRLVSEQVSHHPPVSAFHVEHKLYHFSGTTHPKLKFWGKSVEITPKGTMTLHFKERDEYYTWNNPPCCVHNIIVGKLWYEQYGLLEIENHKTGYRCHLNFKSAGWFSKNLHAVEGFILDAQKQKRKFLFGRWVDVFKAADVQQYEEFQKLSDQKPSGGWWSGFHWPHILGGDSKDELSTSPMRSSSAEPDVSTASGVSPGKKSGKRMMSKLNSLTSSVSSAMHSLGPSFSIDLGGSGHPLEKDAPGDAEASSDVEEIPQWPAELPLDIPDAEVLWEYRPKPPRADRYYNFSAFAMSLNEFEPGMLDKLCPTDSRLRPDIRMLEQGRLDEAAAEKNRLEEKQREARKARKRTKNKQADWKPRWFASGKNPATGAEDWVYLGGFWDNKRSEEIDIF